MKLFEYSKNASCNQKKNQSNERNTFKSKTRTKLKLYKANPEQRKASVSGCYKADPKKKASFRDSYKADTEKKKASAVRDSYKADPEKKMASVQMRQLQRTN